MSTRAPPLNQLCLRTSLGCTEDTDVIDLRHHHVPSSKHLARRLRLHPRRPELIHVRVTLHRRDHVNLVVEETGRNDLPFRSVGVAAGPNGSRPHGRLFSRRPTGRRCRTEEAFANRRFAPSGTDPRARRVCQSRLPAQKRSFAPLDRVDEGARPVSHLLARQRVSRSAHHKRDPLVVTCADPFPNGLPVGRHLHDSPRPYFSQE